MVAKKFMENKEELMGEDCRWKNVRRVAPGTPPQKLTNFQKHNLMPSSIRKSLRQSSVHSQQKYTSSDVGYAIGETVCIRIYPTPRIWKNSWSQFFERNRYHGSYFVSYDDNRQYNISLQKNIFLPSSALSTLPYENQILHSASVGWSVGWSVTLELKSGKTRISTPAHPSATGIGHVSVLVE